MTCFRIEPSVQLFYDIALDAFGHHRAQVHDVASSKKQLHILARSEAQAIFGGREVSDGSNLPVDNRNAITIYLFDAGAKPDANIVQNVIINAGSCDKVVCVMKGDGGEVMTVGRPFKYFHYDV